jgi:membrane-associated phospholipid phosphatase
VTTVIGSAQRDFSFPSGPTTNATLAYVLAALLLTAGMRRALWRRVTSASAVALAFLVGLSRIYLGYHWATDVLAGWLLATAVIAASYFAGRGLGLVDYQDASVDVTHPGRDHRSQPRHLV